MSFKPIPFDLCPPTTPSQPTHSCTSWSFLQESNLISSFYRDHPDKWPKLFHRWQPFGKDGRVGGWRSGFQLFVFLFTTCYLSFRVILSIKIKKKGHQCKKQSRLSPNYCLLLTWKPKPTPVPCSLANSLPPSSCWVFFFQNHFFSVCCNCFHFS